MIAINSFITVRCTGGPLKEIEVPIMISMTQPVPPTLTLRHKPHLHQYKYIGRNAQRQHCYEYTHTN